MGALRYCYESTGNHHKIHKPLVTLSGVTQSTVTTSFQLGGFFHSVMEKLPFLNI